MTKVAENKYFIVAFFAALFLWQVFLLGGWLRQDQRPAAWDQSVHLSSALTYRQAFASLSIKNLLIVKSWAGHPPYPPLVHYLMAPCLSLAGVAGLTLEDAAALVNLVFLMVLAVGAWLLACAWWGAPAGLCAALMASLSPPVLLYAHEPLVDLALTSWVVLAYAFYVKSRCFENPGWGLALGAVLGLGMLIKWTFFLYLLPVGGAAAWRLLREWKTSAAKNILRSLGAAVLLVAPWYVPNLFAMIPRIVRAVACGKAEGDPDIWTAASWLWYSRVMVQHVSLWGVAAGAGGLAWVFARRRGGWPLGRPVGGRGGSLLGAWLLCGYVVWSLVSNKNDRYFLPAEIVLPLAAASLPLHLPKVLAAGAVIFSSVFARLDPPRPGVWPLEAMVEHVAQARDKKEPFALLTLAANHPYLNGNNLRWVPHKMGLGETVIARSKVEPLGQFSEFVLIKTGDLGPASGHHAAARGAALENNGWFFRAFEQKAAWPLPDGSQGLLFQRRPDIPAALLPAGLVDGLIPGWRMENVLVREESSGAFPGERAWRLRAERVSVKGLLLDNVELLLDGVEAAPDSRGVVVLLRLRRLAVLSARLTEEAAAAYLRAKAKWLKEPAVVFAPGGLWSVRGRAGPLGLEARLKVVCPQVFVLNISLEGLSVGGCRLPIHFAKTVSLRPTKGMPFRLELSGLETGPGALTVSNQREEK